jgi:glutamyl-tRNA synthetase
MRTMDGDVTGVAEPAFSDAAVDDVVQFERVGFVRVDRTADRVTESRSSADGDEGAVVYFAHE